MRRNRRVRPQAKVKSHHVAFTSCEAPRFRASAAPLHGSQKIRDRFQSSGDLLADRRAGYAAELAAERDFAAAAEVMGQALERAPGWAAGWSLYGDYLRDAGSLERALAAWQELQRLDADGIFGAALKLAAHGGLAKAQTTQVGYVEALFDAYATEFEEELLTWLHYSTPRELSGLIERALGDRIADRCFDLGCGTGLMGERLRDRTRELVGVDLSAGMLAEARRKGLYDRLEHAELVDFLGRQTDTADLVVAADVFVYVGALEPVFPLVRAVLKTGGLFAFSVEAHDGVEPVMVRESYRFAHSEAGVLAALAAAGLTLVGLNRTTLRYDRGSPIEGFIVLARL